MFEPVSGLPPCYLLFLESCPTKHDQVSLYYDVLLQLPIITLPQIWQHHLVPLRFHLFLLLHNPYGFQPISSRGGTIYTKQRPS